MGKRSRESTTTPPSPAGSRCRLLSRPRPAPISNTSCARPSPPSASSPSEPTHTKTPFDAHFVEADAKLDESTLRPPRELAHGRLRAPWREAVVAVGLGSALRVVRRARASAPFTPAAHCLGPGSGRATPVAHAPRRARPRSPSASLTAHLPLATAGARHGHSHASAPL